MPIRLSAAERAQIASGAARLNLPFSSFVRHAALQASAVVEKKVEVKPRPTPRREVPAPVLEEPEPHFVDGELVVVPHYTGTPRRRDTLCDRRESRGAA